MKAKILIVLSLVLVSCNQQKIEDISLLNGYWEIEKVTFPSGDDKEYKVNTVIDYIQIKDSVGTREKVMPRLDGRFTSMKEYENFSIKKEGDDFYIVYKNEESERREKIEILTKDKFGVSNEQDKTYFYKRFEKFSLK
ncbi:lipocalin family protein [Joostella atrarenae]|uniref:Lipocalin family protein n=1 Tax=Joostella atrarenae TaxID=679257 RepID=A0ABS9J346_9FLAO|nr:lipocalin family protein [Joostella atrarenae]MCF8714847.1 lipocalin family protein [Joostella atrarenae]